MEELEVATMFRLTSRVLDLCQEFPIVMINYPCITRQSNDCSQVTERDLEFSEPGNPFRYFKDRRLTSPHCHCLETVVTSKNTLHMVQYWQVLDSILAGVGPLYGKCVWVVDSALLSFLRVKMTGRTGGGSILQYLSSLLLCFSCRASSRNIATHYML